MLKLSLLTGLCLTAWADTHYVDINSTNPVTPYTSWVTAATNIQHAVDVAISGDTLLVTNGIYYERITVTNNITILSVNGPEVTIIDRQNLGSYSVFTLKSACTLSGFTVRNGGYTEVGGGIACLDPASPYLIYTPFITNCVISGNLAKYGGGIAGGTLSHCIINDNLLQAIGGSAGGGSFYSILSHCSIADNSISGHGGSGAGSYGCTLTSCIITGNQAITGAGNGGGSAYDTLTNCLIIGNAGRDGGGSFESTLFNCTIVSNSADLSGGGTRGCIINNSIIWNNTGGDIYLGSISNSCSPDITHGVGGNITNNPLFISTNNYHLSSNSPCIDAGTFIAGLGYDLDGIPRPLDGDNDGTLQFDMGAYEFVDTAPGADPDGDGASNSDEQIADTDELDGNDWFYIATMSLGASNTVSFSSSASRKYTLLITTNIVDGPWVPEAGQTNIIGTGAELQLSAAASTNTETFYKVEVGVP